MKLSIRMQQLLIGVNISYVIHISIARNHFLSQNSELLRLSCHLWTGKTQWSNKSWYIPALWESPHSWKGAPLTSLPGGQHVLVWGRTPSIFHSSLPWRKVCFPLAMISKRINITVLVTRSNLLTTSKTNWWNLEVRRKIFLKHFGVTNWETSKMGLWCQGKFVKRGRGLKGEVQLGPRASPSVDRTWLLHTSASSGLSTKERFMKPVFGQPVKLKEFWHTERMFRWGAGKLIKGNMSLKVVQAK